MASSAALNALGHASSGSVGTAISTAALYPLDLITTRLKTQKTLGNDTQYAGIVDAFKDIVKNEGGVSALYSGLGTDVGKSVVDSFLFFGFYSYLSRHAKQPPRILQELALGALAGAASRALTTPIANVVTRKQTSKGDETLGEMLKDIYNQSGVLGLWSGYSATLVLTMNPSITFFVNRRLAKKIIPALEEEDVPVAYIAFLLAACSKAFATAFTYPFNTGKTRLQIARTPQKEFEKHERSLSPAAPPKSFLSRLLRFFDETIFGVIIRIIKSEGVKALYAGIQGELLKSFFSHGLTMFTKGVLHRLIVRMWLLYSPQLRQRLQKK